MDSDDLRAEYAEEMWVHRTGAEERYCINPKCKAYHDRVWSVPRKDYDTGQHWMEPDHCPECGMTLDEYETDPYEMLGEYFTGLVEKAIREKDWDGRAYEIYQRVLDVWESRR